MTFQMLVYGLLALPFVLLVSLFLLTKPVRALFAFILILPFHSFLVTVLLVQIGLPMPLVKLASTWKEVLLLSTFLVVSLNFIVRKDNIRLVWLDWIAVAWLFQICFYFAFHNLLFDWSSSLAVRAYGARDWLLYLLPYFIGRFVVVSEKSAKRILKALLFVGVATSLIGIVDRIFVPTSWHVAFGVPTYMMSFLSLSYPGYLGGLPPNYWAEFGGDAVRRAVSVYFSAQGFAISFLLILPVAVYSYYTRFAKYARLTLGLCIFALILTLTRTTIFTCFLQGLLIMWLLHKKRKVITIIAIITLLSIIAIGADASLRNYLINTVTLQDTSSSVRPARWASGFKMLAEYPLGDGLGISGATGTRFGLEGGGGGDEAGYFKITGALGFPGLFLFLGWFLGVLFYAYRLLRYRRGVWQGIALVTFVGALGFLLNNLTAPPDQLPFLIYVFAWLAGLTVHYVTTQLPIRRVESVVAT